MALQSLTKFLTENQIRYQSIKHSPAYTACEIAQAANIPGKELIKTVIIKLHDKYAMLVLTANQKVNFRLLEKELGDRVELASESEFKDKFPDCEVGAMPPFGNLYHMDVFVDEKVTEDDRIAFNGGSHTELLSMKYKDFEKLVHPKVLHATEWQTI